MDVAALVAVDVHVHASVHAPGGNQDRLREMSEYFPAGEVAAHSVPCIAEYYRSRQIAAVVVGVDTVADGDAPGKPSNEEVAELAASTPTSSSPSPASTQREMPTPWHAAAGWPVEG
jgi:hypothetical protein